MRGSLASMDKEGKLPRILFAAMANQGRYVPIYTTKQEGMEKKKKWWPTLTLV